MTFGLLLHLSGPLQSWGAHSTWGERDTHTHPTRSGLIGLIAAASGHQRHEPLAPYQPLQFTIRIDRPGRRLIDFHTVGGGRTREESVPLAGGGRRAEGKGTIVTNRHYLSDAAFTVAVTGPGTLLTGIADALRVPHWAPYLGRRACPAATPLFFGAHTNAVQALHEEIPLHRSLNNKADPIEIEFVADERPPDDDVWADEIPDDPVTFHPDERAHRYRPAYRYRRNLPGHLCAGMGSDYLRAVAEVIKNG
ncbi:MAG TPA: type I-E CRISPR-associated protein Cas5/CasD [Amycolatopsis sp.]|uniref:type I-E CRISPR-associated protein Cas5/CasD n=1 Tax=Amycolatopsis sp. TaxID=37632 RepID=UPI002B4630DE|nr:type I-E CRISPR-associated protein Cas5/CasD [Amycolatopsis sp.]HKS46163.1 type I-E CRISPR-associated protein Cas5/CasD [Amycolatopsis sp.]